MKKCNNFHVFNGLCFFHYRNSVNSDNNFDFLIAIFKATLYFRRQNNNQINLSHENRKKTSKSTIKV